MDKGGRTRVRMDRTQQEVLISFIALHKADLWTKPNTNEEKTRQNNLLTQLGLQMEQHGLSRNLAEWQKMFINWRSVVRTKLARKTKEGQTLSEFERALVAVMPESEDINKQDPPASIEPNKSPTKTRVSSNAQVKRCGKQRDESKTFEDKLKRLIEIQEMRSGSIEALNNVVNRLSNTVEKLTHILDDYPSICLGLSQKQPEEMT